MRNRRDLVKNNNSSSNYRQNTVPINLDDNINAERACVVHKVSTEMKTT